MFNSFCIISCKVTNLFSFYKTKKIQLSAKNVFMTYSNGTQSPKRDAGYINGIPFMQLRKTFRRLLYVNFQPAVAGLDDI